MSEVVGIAIVLSGVAVAAIGLVWLAVRAFRTKLWWGLSVLFLPGAALVYPIKHWDRARRPIVVMLVGALIILLPYGINFAADHLITLGEHERRVDGEVHLTLTGWDRADYSLLKWKRSTAVLQMANSDVTDETLAFIAGMSDLKELDLSKTQVTDAGLKIVAELPKLERLRLADTSITDAGFRETLLPKESLVFLDLRRTKVSRSTVGEWKKTVSGREAMR